jgi:hypothetical protein
MLVGLRTGRSSSASTRDSPVPWRSVEVVGVRAGAPEMLLLLLLLGRLG